jgi:glycine C-acetyltransferase
VFASVQQEIKDQLSEIRSAGLFKDERVIVSPQGSSIRVADGKEVLNLCANNYLGLADDPRIVTAAKEALDRWGYGLASVRFICGTQDVHKQLERRISAFLGTEDTILYSSCFDANGGLFGTLLGSGCARPGDCATTTATWVTSKISSRPARMRGAGSLPPMACFPWTDMSRRSAKSVT